MGTITIIGTDEADFIDALDHPNSTSAFFIDGRGGSDTIKGGLDDDTLIGGSGDDLITLIDNSGSDTILHQPGDGNDTIAGFQSFSHDTGRDQIDLTGHDFLFSDLTTRPANPPFLEAGTEILLPTGEILFLAGFSSILSPLDFIGLPENTAGDDLVIDSFGDTNLSGGTGNDTLQAAGGNNSFAGDAGNDWVDYSNQDAHIAASLTDGQAVSLRTYTLPVGQTADPGDLYGLEEVIYTDTLSGVENLTGSRFDDILEGNGANNHLVGGQGSDTLISVRGNDTLTGGEGADHFALTRGIFSQPKVTVISDFEVFRDDIDLSAFRYSYSDLNIALDPTGQNTVISLPNRDQIVLKGYTGPLSEENFIFTHPDGAFTLVELTADDDLFTGSNDAEVIRGFQGNDTIFAGGGDDLVFGEDGDDQLDGGAGDDEIVDLLGANIISGGAGNDHFTVASHGSRLTGGEGRDFFSFDDQFGVLQGSITITDFEQGFDLIGIGGLSITFEQVLISLQSSDTVLTLGTGGHEFVLEGFTDPLTRADFSEDLNPDDFQFVGGNGSDALIGSTLQAEIFSGQGGNDTIVSFGGDDTLIGGAGDDHLVAGTGDNELSGGFGADRFLFIDPLLHTNVITDFEADLDIIELSQLGLDFSDLLTIRSGDDTFIFFAGQIGSITLENTDPSFLTEDHFQF